MSQTYILPGKCSGTCDVCYEIKDVEKLIKVLVDCYAYRPLEIDIKVFYRRKAAWICMLCAEHHKVTVVDTNMCLIETGALCVPRMVCDEKQLGCCSKCKGISQVLDGVKRNKPMSEAAFLLIQEELICFWCVRHCDHFIIPCEREDA